MPVSLHPFNQSFIQLLRYRKWKKMNKVPWSRRGRKMSTDYDRIYAGHCTAFIPHPDNNPANTVTRQAAPAAESPHPRAYLPYPSGFYPILSLSLGPLFPLPFQLTLLRKVSSSAPALPTMAQADWPQAEGLKKAAWASVMTPGARSACSAFWVLEPVGSRKEEAGSWQAKHG